MRPKEKEASPQDDLFREKLTNLLNLRRCAAWRDSSRGTRWTLRRVVHGGRLGTATRLMAGLQYLKHSYNLSDEEVIAGWVENPYWQYFCGEEYFQQLIRRK